MSALLRRARSILEHRGIYVSRRRPLSASDLVVSLLFPRASAEVRAALKARLPEGDTVRTEDVRRLLAAVDRMHTVSPVLMRPLRDDLHRVDLGDFAMWVDEADPSVSRTLMDLGSYEPAMTEVFRHFLRPGDTAVDVGANIGYLTLVAATGVGPEGKVVAVEANPENARLLLASLAENDLKHVTLAPLAVSDEPGWSYFSAHLGSNGGLVPSELESLLDSPGQVVATSTLDTLLGDEPVHLLKMDVEGAEGRALTGALGVIDRHHPIVTSEISFEMLERVSAMSPHHYLGLLLDRGYQGYVLEKEPMGLRPFATADELCADWPDPFHLDDLVFLPPGRVEQAAMFALAPRGG